MEGVEHAAGEAGCACLWLVATNDILGRMRLDQRRGFALVAFARNTANRCRRLKPGIPLISDFGIPLRDELTLDKCLKEGTSDTSRL